MTTTNPRHTPTITAVNTQAICTARSESPDWKEAVSVRDGLMLGQQVLNITNVKERMDALQPEYRERVLELIKRWAELYCDAEALVAEIDTHIQAANA